MPTLALVQEPVTPGFRTNLLRRTLFAHITDAWNVPPESTKASAIANTRDKMRDIDISYPAEAVVEAERNRFALSRVCPFSVSCQAMLGSVLIEVN